VDDDPNLWTTYILVTTRCRGPTVGREIRQRKFRTACRRRNEGLVTSPAGRHGNGETVGVEGDAEGQPARIVRR
jgi:hypothetical protein